MPRIDQIADRYAHRTCHKRLAEALDRPDIAGLFDEDGVDVASEVLEWSARQALEAYARSTSPARAAALAGEFITAALMGDVR